MAVHVIVLLQDIETERPDHFFHAQHHVVDIVRLRSEQPFDRALGVGEQFFLIDGRDRSVIKHHPAADHHAVDCGPVLRINHLHGGNIERHVVDIAEIEKHHVGLVARGDPADGVAHAQGPGAAPGRRRQHRVGG